jgi:ABC-2 type transport system permease protein
MRTLVKLTWVETKLFVRDPLTLVFTLAFPLINLVVLAGVFGNTPDPGFYRGVGAIDYYVGAYIGLVIAAFGVVALPVHLTSYRERGVLRRFRASSISIWSMLGSQLAVSLALAVAGSILLFVLATIIYDVNPPQQLELLVAAFVLSVLCLTAFGFLLGSILPTTRAAQGIGIILYLLFLILGGAGPPPEVLPDAMRTVGDFTPVRYVILLLQDPWLGFGWGVRSSLITAGIMAGAALLSARFFRWE